MPRSALSIVCSGFTLWLWACDAAPARPALPAAPGKASLAASAALRPWLTPDAGASTHAVSPPPARERAPAPRAGMEVAIGAGALRLGSATGSAYKNPAREADEHVVSLAGFAIDALPYPNDPAQPARGASSRDEASGLCAEQGKRLCSELEWERACKGEHDSPYPSALPFDAAACARDALACATDAGVFALGTLGREWTSSAAGPADWDRLRTAVVRGASKDAAAPLHRCAARDAAAPESRSDSLLFRCCRGAPQTAEYPVQPDAGAFRALTLSSEAASSLLESMPETRALAAGFRLQRTQALAEALKVSGRAPTSLSPWQAASPAFGWSPLRGEELVVLSGDSPRGALVIAYYPLPDGRARFAGSYETRDEHTPILIAYKPDLRDELLFTTCWGCGGEGGALRLSAETRLRFLPR